MGFHSDRGWSPSAAIWFESRWGHLLDLLLWRLQRLCPLVGSIVGSARRMVQPRLPRPPPPGPHRAVAFGSFGAVVFTGIDVQVGGGKTVHLGAAPGLRLDAAGLNQVRHHAVLGHGLAVEAIRARGPADTKVGFAENVRVAVPVMDPEKVRAAELVTRDGGGPAGIGGSGGPAAVELLIRELARRAGPGGPVGPCAEDGRGPAVLVSRFRCRSGPGSSLR
jgi:hypothetical protein